MPTLARNDDGSRLLIILIISKEAIKSNDMPIDGHPRTRVGENRQLVTEEPVEFEK
jgi:hypothetical protein